MRSFFGVLLASVLFIANCEAGALHSKPPSSESKPAKKYASTPAPQPEETPQTLTPPPISMTQEELEMDSTDFIATVILASIDNEHHRLFYPVCQYLLELNLKKAQARQTTKAATGVHPSNYEIFIERCRAQLTGDIDDETRAATIGRIAASLSRAV